LNKELTILEIIKRIFDSEIKNKTSQSSDELTVFFNKKKSAKIKIIEKK